MAELDQVSLVEVVKRYGETSVLHGVSLQLKPGGIVGILGSSGCGKTTLLRLIAGLEAPTAGTILFQRDQSGDQAVRANIGMVFQNLALWPHLSAWQHLECVLSGLDRAERRARVESLLQEVRLPPAAWQRPPSQLSGGEGQRLALARALAADPELLLLDEPLAHLDAHLRGELLELVTAVAAARKRIVLYVTHAWAEAAALCANIAVLDNGRIAQLGSPHELFAAPASLAVARLTGGVVELPRDWLTTGLLVVEGAAAASALLPSENDDVLLLRPHQLRLVEAAHRPWTVVRCMPQENAWVATLHHDQAGVLRVPTPQPIDAGSAVAVGLRDPAGGSLQA